MENFAKNVMYADMIMEAVANIDRKFIAPAICATLDVKYGTDDAEAIVREMRILMDDVHAEEAEEV